MIPLVLLASAAALWWALRAAGADAASAPPGVVTVYRGVPYRFVVQLDTSAASASAQTALHAALTAAGATDIAFVTTATESRVVFRITPKATDTTSLGAPLTGLGRIESITRLDGAPFGAPTP